MKKKQAIILHTGSNIGNRIANLQMANALIKKQIGEIVKTSNYYHTKAWGVTNQPDFINQAIETNTILSPFELLENIHQIEEKMGRVRHQKWEERLIDIDILFYENEIIDTKNLKIPHPFLQERNFVLVPLQEIAGDRKHPVLNLTILELLEKTKDDLAVLPFPE